MNQVLAIAAGGAVGSVLRFWLTKAVHTMTGYAFPYGTLAVNVLGCLAMGWLFVTFVERGLSDGPWRAGLLVGVLGGFTTFSAFSMETVRLIEQGTAFQAVVNIAASVTLCLAATWAGMLLARGLG